VPSADSVSILKNGTAEFEIDLIRTGGFKGPIALSVTGAPDDLIATIEPQVTTGGMVRLVLTSTTATAAHGSVLTITATAPGRSDRNKVVHVRVSDVVIGVGNVTVDFSLCAAEDRPVWFASQDGSGPWTQVIGAAGVYRFEVRTRRRQLRPEQAA
jgi:hypothetical protein